METRTCTTAGAPTCVVSGLTGYADLSTQQFTIAVRGRNIAGWGPTRTVNGFYLNPLGNPYVAPVVPVPGRHQPDPVVDIRSTSTNALEVVIPGYIAAPQGVVSVAVTNPSNKDVSLSGGVLAAWSAVADPRPTAFRYGLVNPTTQRTVLITTQVSGSNITSEAVVQVNETGAWAVNSWQVG
jgi:hypothetical protein